MFNKLKGAAKAALQYMQKDVREVAADIGNAALALTTAVGLTTMTVAEQAHAALPASVSTAFSTLETDAGSLIDLVWPVVITVTVGFVLIKLFKRGANKT